MSCLTEVGLTDGKQKIDRRHKLKSLRCPKCFNSALDETDDCVSCLYCNEIFPKLTSNVIDMLQHRDRLSDIKHDIQDFWTDLYQQWYQQFDEEITEKTILQHLDEMEVVFNHRSLLPVIELKKAEINGKNILEIGCGGGGHSLYFKRYGAAVTAVDITPERIISAAKKLRLLHSKCPEMCYLADAENLPFEDSTFDIVYSNGVLHHSESVEKCMSEVHRVLKKEGDAVIMLYSRHSSQFWLNLLPKSILTGLFFCKKEKYWLGILTEGKPKNNTVSNPLTRVYSKVEILRLFEKFHITSMRKNGFLFSQLPYLNRPRSFILKRLGKKALPGGTILYGSPFLAETNLERKLGKYIGWSWNIRAKKQC